MQKLKAILVLFVIILSLIPIYLFYKYLRKKMKPEESFGRFFLFIVAALASIFIYTSLIVLLIGLVFPHA
jgi:hypothetical protein